MRVDADAGDVGGDSGEPFGPLDGGGGVVGAVEVVLLDDGVLVHVASTVGNRVLA